jgi:hypothetical protein
MRVATATTRARSWPALKTPSVIRRRTFLNHAQSDIRTEHNFADGIWNLSFGIRDPKFGIRYLESMAQTACASLSPPDTSRPRQISL